MFFGGVLKLVNERTGIDQFMRRQIESIGVDYEEQGSSHVEIKKALRTASKQKEGNVGKPEFIFFSDKYLIVAEDKADVEKMVKYNSEGEIDLTRPIYALFGNDVRKVRLKNGYNESRYISLFITTVLMRQKEKYSYSVKMGTKRLRQQKIMLPVNDKREPDWGFMEQYMKRMENRVMKQSKTSLGR